MSKITLDDAVSGYNLSVINDNFTKIEDALNTKVLYRDNPLGEPNSLQQDLDVNGKRLLNVGGLDIGGVNIADAIADAEASAAAAALSATNAATSEANAEAVFDEFKNRYQGPYAVPPTTRADGSPLQDGDLYYSTIIPKRIKVWDGAGWTSTGSVIPAYINKPDTPVIATAGQTVVDVPNGYDARYIAVWVNGVKIDNPEIDISSGTAIVFSTPLNVNDEVSWIAFSAIEIEQNLRTDLAAATGASLVGFTKPGGGTTTLDQLATTSGALMLGTADGGTLASSLVSKINRVVSSITALRALDKTKYTQACVTGYYSPYDGGGGIYCYDSADTTSMDNGGTIIVASDGGRWKLSQSYPVSVKQFGAKGDGAQDDTSFIQNALDTAKVVRLPVGTFKTTAPLDFKNDGTRILGEGRSLSIINYTGTVSAIRNPNSATTTRLWCGLHDLKVQASTIGGSRVVDWKSMQFGQLRNVWVTGQSILGCVAIGLDAVWTTTEATYNLIEGCYIGLCAIGITIGDGGNTNTIIANRFQVSVSGGIGIQLSATAADRISNNQILSNGFEYPGAINTGINILQNTDGTVIIGNRFEQLQNAIVIGATSNKGVFAPYSQNYFSSCTTNINNTGSNRVAPTIRASASINGSGGAVINGNAFNLTVVRNSTGSYTFTFVDPMPDANYVVNASSISHLTTLGAKSATAFTINTFNVSVVATDSSVLDVQVVHNR